MILDKSIYGSLRKGKKNKKTKILRKLHNVNAKKGEEEKGNKVKLQAYMDGNIFGLKV